jgi:putative DNA primase/helicase
MPDEIKTPFLFTEDSTPETMQRLLSENKGRVSVFSDEPGLFRILGGLYNKGSASLDVFLKGHVGSPLKVERAARSVFVKRPSLTLSLMIQPDIVKELAGSSQFRSSGLMARFFYAVPRSNVGHRDVRKRSRVPCDLVDSYDAAVLSLMEGYPPDAGVSLKPKMLYLDDLADDLWLDFSQEIEDQLKVGGKLDSICDWASKLPGAVARVASLIELATHGLGVQTVGLESMQKAIQLGMLMIPHTQAAFSMLNADPVESDASHVLQWMKWQGKSEFTRREVQKALEGRFRTIEKLSKALNKLTDWGCIRQTERKNSKARATSLMKVNPLALM